jgi:ribosomal protein S12 methylthiotransferase accessory factor YcaO
MKAGMIFARKTTWRSRLDGFLHHLSLINEDGSRTAPSQLTNAERKRRISEAWFEHIRKYPTSSQNPVIQHRLVFSMSREMHDKLVNAGINPDRVLQSTTKRMMGKVQRVVSSGRLDWLRLRDSPRHG